MSSLNYWYPQLEETGRILDSQGDPDVKSVLVVSTGTDEAEAFDTYLRTCARLDSLKDAGLVLGRDSASFFLVPPAEREARLARWKAWWTEERKDSLKCLTREAAVRNGFRDNAFDDAIESLSNAGAGPDYFGDVPVALSAWTGESDTRKMLISKVDFPVADIGQAYSALDAPGVVVFDQGYFIACRAEEFIVVRNNADSDSRIAHARDLGIYSTHVAIIQATRRLVENHRAGTRKQTSSDGKPLALPA